MLRSHPFSMHHVLHPPTILMYPHYLMCTGEPKDDIALDVVLHKQSRGARIFTSAHLPDRHFLAEPGMWIAFCVARALHLLSTWICVFFVEVTFHPVGTQPAGGCSVSGTGLQHVSISPFVQLFI